MNGPQSSSQSSRGVPHFTYYDKQSGTYFVWNGRFADGIEVNPGRGTKPVKTTIPLTRPLTGAAMPNDWLEWFRNHCVAYLRRSKPKISEDDRKDMLHD